MFLFYSYKILFLLIFICKYLIYWCNIYVEKIFQKNHKKQYYYSCQ